MADFYDKDKLINDRDAFIKQRDAIDQQITELNAQKDALTVTIEQIDDVLNYIDAGYPEVAVLAAPATLTATPAEESAVLEWDASGDATGYVVEMATNSSFTDSEVIYTGSSLTYTKTGLVVGVTYYFRVKATADDIADSDWTTASVVILDKLTTPANILLTTGDGTEKTQWDDVPFASGYKVYRTTTNVAPTDDTNLIADTADSEYIDEDESLIVGQQYYYWVKAYSTSFLDSDFASDHIIIE